MLVTFQDLKRSQIGVRASYIKEKKGGLRQKGKY
jgi:hypothetical protein